MSHRSKESTAFIRELKVVVDACIGFRQPYEGATAVYYCSLVKAKRSSFTKPSTIPDHIGGLCFADMRGPLEVDRSREASLKLVLLRKQQDFCG